MSTITFGGGNLKFGLVQGWEQLPEGWTHPDVAGVATDSEGNVYLLCRGEHPVIVYNRGGVFLGSWGEGRFTLRVHSIYIHNDVVYLVDDGANSVGRYTLAGELIDYIGPVGVASATGYVPGDLDSLTNGAGPYNRPTNVAVAPNNDIYVADGYGNSRIHRFDSRGDLLGSWGEPGSGPGQFRVPHGIWVHPDERVFVADRQNERLQIFSPTGEFLEQWDDVQRPQDLCIDADGLVYVAELSWREGMHSWRDGILRRNFPGRLSIFDPDGKVLLRWSDEDPYKDGYFIAPHGMCIDDEGSLYFAEVTNTVAVSEGWAGSDAHTFQKFARL